MLILGIETSCDETSAALVRDGRETLSLVVASQVAEHRPFGGVVPELASRGHMRKMLPVLEQAMREAGADWDAVDAVAATAGPGLIGSLLVGFETAKALAWLRGKPFLPTHHLLGHLDSVHVAAPGRDPSAVPERKYPSLGLVASGGHTAFYRVEGPSRVELLGETLDDAVGEAYDKAAKLLGLGYPGGPLLDRLAATGNPKAFDLPRPVLHKPGFDFSFSGLKTAVARLAEIEERDGRDARREDFVRDIAASFQAAAVEVLLVKAKRALVETGLKRLAITGGVACNRGLRAAAAGLKGVQVALPPPEFCTDNAAMIAGVGFHALRERGPSGLGVNAEPSLAL
jgi:N6-L-threonylcarbamoyladenine synthase